MFNVHVLSDLLFLDVHTECTCYFRAHMNLGVLPFTVLTCWGLACADISLSILKPVS